MARYIIAAFAVALLSGCATTSTTPTYSEMEVPPERSAKIFLETSRPVWVRGNEVWRYACVHAEATLACENQGSRVLQQRCTCRFY